LNAGVVISTPAFSCHRNCVKAFSAVLLCLVGLAVVSCSDKSGSEPENKESEAQPREDEIGEDCVAFVRATKVLPTQAECAGCSGDAREALTFRQMKVDRISCSADSCEVTVTVRASFTPGQGGTISGGLTAWISSEQRQQYLSGHPPEGEQVYPVKISYKRRGEQWRATEFDRAELK
jgi:hypothetical protein